MFHAKEGYIPVKGGRVWFKVVGAGRRGIPFLTLHGGPGAPHDYLEPLEALSDERPVIFYDQLGCGNSDRPEDVSLFTVERFVDELHCVRESLGLAKVHIMGQSWGTMLAVDYMLAGHSEGVASLVLSSPVLSASRFAADQRKYLLELPAEHREAIGEGEASGAFGTPGYEAAVTAYYARHLCRLYPWPECMERTLAGLGRTVYEYMWGPSEFTLTGTLGDYERAEHLKGIRTPVLFTVGRYDEATPVAAKYYHAMLPGSEVVVFEDASHEHHIEKPGPYLSTVRAFLRHVEGE